MRKILFLLFLLAYEVRAHEGNQNHRVSCFQGRQTFNFTLAFVEFEDQSLDSCDSEINKNLLDYTNGHLEIGDIEQKGPIKISYNSQKSGCDYNQILALARKKIAATHPYTIYVIPRGACWFRSLASGKSGWGLSTSCLEPLYHIIGHFQGLHHEQGALDSPMALDLDTSVQGPYSAAQMAMKGWIPTCEIIPSDKLQETQDFLVELAPKNLPSKCTSKCQVVLFQGKKDAWYISYGDAIGLSIHRSKGKKGPSRTKLQYILAPGLSFAHPDWNNFTVTNEYMRPGQGILMRFRDPRGSFLPAKIIEKAQFCEEDTPDNTNENCTKYQLASAGLLMAPTWVVPVLAINAFLYFGGYL